jgi:hypothetical protein
MILRHQMGRFSVLSCDNTARPLWLALFIGLACSQCLGATITESFSTDPESRGWRSFGITNLLMWNSTNQNLTAIWDSSQSNSFFFLPLQTILTRADDFSMALDLYLNDVNAGIDPSKQSTFEFTFGFLNLDNATKPGFLRAGGVSPNLVEFDYFPDTGFGGTVWPSFWSTNSSLNYGGSSDYTLVDLPVRRQMHISLSYTASNSTLTTEVLTNGAPFVPIHAVKLSNSFTDFRVGAFAIESYSDAGQDPSYGGSLLAHGTVDNIVLTVPDPPVRNLSLGKMDNQWQATFLGNSNWVYLLERTTNFVNWSATSSIVPGNGGILVLSDTNGPTGAGFYRVRAQRP